MKSHLFVYCSILLGMFIAQPLKANTEVSSFPTIVFDRKLTVNDWKFLETQSTYFGLVLPRTETRDDDVKKLKGLKNLKSLSLAGCSQITPKGLNIIANLKDLEILDLSHTQICDDNLKKMKNLKNLKILTLLNCELITDEGIQYIGDFENLESLDLSYCRQITDKGIMHLKTLVCLQELYLSDCKMITRASISEITKIPNLKVLLFNILYTKITPEDLKQIACHPNLECVTLNHCNNITTQDVKNLLKKKKLRILCLDDCEQITESDINDLKKTYTGCNISIMKPLNIFPRRPLRNSL